MATAAQTLQAILDHLGLEKGATEEDITLAIAQREEAAKASARTRVSVAKWTPQVISDGEMKFSGSKVRLAADEIDPLRNALNSDEFAAFLAENADALQARAEVSKARKARRAAARATEEEDAA
jgi:hypothetical protein